MTKILKRLEEAGYVTRSPDPDDGRGMRVTLTDRGRSLQDRVFHAFLAVTTSLMAPLTAHQVTAADKSLGEILELFERRGRRSVVRYGQRERASGGIRHYAPPNARGDGLRDRVRGSGAVGVRPSLLWGR